MTNDFKMLRCVMSEAGPAVVELLDNLSTIVNVSLKLAVGELNRLGGVKRFKRNRIYYLEGRCFYDIVFPTTDLASR